MEKYGFVYLWYDRKHKRFYIGCRWGNENDGYVCSSFWMKRAQKLRPEDFKRRILARVYTNRKELLTEEHRWLSKIKPEEIGKRYYNLTTHHNGHWSTDEEKAKTLKEKVAKKTKEAMWRPDVREKYLETLKTRKVNTSPEVLEKRRKSMIKTMAEKFPEDQRKKRLSRDDPKLIDMYTQKSKEMWKRRTEDEKEELGNKISQALMASKEKRSVYMSSLKWWNNGINNKRASTCPGPEWVPGRH